MRELKCKQCGYVWNPRTANPKQCPKCKRYDYNPKKPEHIMVSEIPENHTSNIEEMLKRKLDQR